MFLLATAALALAADGPARVGPSTGDHPGTEILVPDQRVGAFAARLVPLRCTFGAGRFGPLPIRWTFDHELAASLALVAPMPLVPDEAAPPAPAPDEAAPATPAPPAP